MTTDPLWDELQAVKAEYCGCDGFTTCRWCSHPLKAHAYLWCSMCYEELLLHRPRWKSNAPAADHLFGCPHEPVIQQRLDRAFRGRIREEAETVAIGELWGAKADELIREELAPTDHPEMPEGGDDYNAWDDRSFLWAVTPTLGELLGGAAGAHDGDPEAARDEVARTLTGIVSYLHDLTRYVRRGSVATDARVEGEVSDTTDAPAYAPSTAPTDHRPCRHCGQPPQGWKHDAPDWWTGHHEWEPRDEEPADRTPEWRRVHEDDVFAVYQRDGEVFYVRRDVERAIESRAEGRMWGLADRDSHLRRLTRALEAANEDVRTAESRAAARYLDDVQRLESTVRMIREERDKLRREVEYWSQRATKAEAALGYCRYLLEQFHRDSHDALESLRAQEGEKADG